MTKFVKMSLAAAVAVAGLSTTASAGDLAEMIKGVDASGYLDYRREYKKTESGSTSTKNLDREEYNVNLTLSTKVNDIVSATVSTGFDEVNVSNTSSSTNTAADADPSINVSNAYFTFNTGVATAMVGKQAIPSVFVDQIDTAKQGDGLVVLAPVGDMVTFGLAYFTTNNISNVFGLSESSTTGDVNGGDTDNDGTANNDAIGAGNTKTTELLAVGKAGIVSYDVHYNMTDVAYLLKGTEADFLYAKVDVAAGPVTVSGKYAAASASSGTAGIKWADSSVMSLGVAGKVAAVKLGATYFSADKELGTNTLQTDVAIDGDNDSKSHVKLWQLSTSAITNKGSGLVFSGSMPFTDALSGKLAYGMATNDGVGTAKDTDYTEILAQLSFKMSKNFGGYFRYSTMNKDTGSGTDTDYDLTRLLVKYTF